MVVWRKINLVGWILLVGWGSQGWLACTDVDVFETPGIGGGQKDNKLRVAGNFCTEHPDELKFPVKIMFIIDCSQSMIVTDPPPSPNELPGRVRAVWDVIQQFRFDPGVSFAIVRFEGAANVATQRDSNGDGTPDQFGFVNDLPSLLRALNSLAAAGGNTSYQAALGLAEATLAMDMSSSAVDERHRTKYVLIFLSDGLPYPVDYDDEVNTPASIQRALKEMMNLPKRFDVADFTFHTAYLSVNTPDYVKQQAEELLKSMKDIGGGTYRNFDNGEEINFLDIDYTSVKRMYMVKNGAFLVSNQNAHPAWSQTEAVDTDGDGLVDIFEEELGTSVANRDTDGDGFNDLLEYNLRLSGFDPLDPDDADCSLALDRLDRDGDGLLDCEERFIGTSPELFDTDADGIPDPVEYRSGTNHAGADADVDQDYDGSLNGHEVAWHTNPRVNDAASFSRLAYRYQFLRIPGIFESRMCYDFSVDNITLVGTREHGPGQPQGYNDIMVYIGQVPQDDPADFGMFRVGCARVQYIPRYPEPDIKIPLSGRVKFEQKDFKRPVATACTSDQECPHHVCDPNDHLCLDPLGSKCDATTPCPNFACLDGPRTGEKTCQYPVAVTCLDAEDCPPFPVKTDPADPDVKICMDALHSSPDPLTGLCPRRECIPQYFTCSPSAPCAADGDTNPDNDPVCLNGFCRVPCFDAGDCNPGETCDPDLEADYPPCQQATECPTADMVCNNNVCRKACVLSTDCPNLTDTCEGDLCVSHHCVDHHGGSCSGVPCTADADCPVQPCDDEVGRCRIQPCLDSRECPYQKCELVLAKCMGPTCADDTDCRGERGYTCNSVIGDPCDRDIDCPYDFCTQQMKTCFFTGEACKSNVDCPPNRCDTQNSVCVNDDSTTCDEDIDCSPNYCRTFYVCANDPATTCTISLDCPQTFCKADGRCLNDTGKTCTAATENIDNKCQVGMCAREAGLGSCDTVERESCQSNEDCPNYQCNASLNLCHYPVEVSCTRAADCPEAGMVCDTTGFCIKRCNSDADCPHSRCQGQCIPMDPNDRTRCTDWFEADRDCKTFE